RLHRRDAPPQQRTDWRGSCRSRKQSFSCRTLLQALSLRPFELSSEALDLLGVEDISNLHDARVGPLLGRETAPDARRKKPQPLVAASQDRPAVFDQERRELVASRRKQV